MNTLVVTAFVIVSSVMWCYSGAYTCNDGCVISDYWVDDSYCDCSDCGDELSWTCGSCGGCPTTCGEYVRCIYTPIFPTSNPTHPSVIPTYAPFGPTSTPTFPTNSPTNSPTSPTSNPTLFPSLNPTLEPTSATDIESIDWIKWNASLPTTMNYIMGMGAYNDTLYIIQSGFSNLSYIYWIDINNLLSFNYIDTVGSWNSQWWGNFDNTSWDSIECNQCFTVSNLYNSIFIVVSDNTWSNNPNKMFIYNMKENRPKQTSEYNYQLLTPSYVEICVTNNGTHVFAIGGRDGYWGNKTTQIYDIVGDRWSFGADMNQRRFQAACAYSNVTNMVYIFGGCYDVYTCDSTNPITVEKYDLEEDDWTLVGSDGWLSGGKLGASALSYENYIFFIGGTDNIYGYGVSVKSTFEVFDVLSEAMIDTQSFEFMPRNGSDDRIATLLYENTGRLSSNVTRRRLSDQIENVDNNDGIIIQVGGNNRRDTVFGFIHDFSEETTTTTTTTTTTIAHEMSTSNYETESSMAMATTPDINENEKNSNENTLVAGLTEMEVIIIGAVFIIVLLIICLFVSRQKCGRSKFSKSTDASQPGAKVSGSKNNDDLDDQFTNIQHAIVKSESRDEYEDGVQITMTTTAGVGEGDNEELTRNGLNQQAIALASRTPTSPSGGNISGSELSGGVFGGLDIAAAPTRQGLPPPPPQTNTNNDSNVAGGVNDAGEGAGDKQNDESDDEMYGATAGGLTGKEGGIMVSGGTKTAEKTMDINQSGDETSSSDNYNEAMTTTGNETITKDQNYMD